MNKQGQVKVKKKNYFILSSPFISMLLLSMSMIKYTAKDNIEEEEEEIKV